MKKENKLLIFGLFAGVLCGQCRPAASQKEPRLPAVVQAKADPCDDPDASVECCFTNMPAQVTERMMITDPNEPGKRIVITGTIFQADGRTPYPDVVMYAYHTDQTGHYAKKGNETGFQKWHGHLHGWCRTDWKGNYEIHSIRPARYPGNTIVAHIHAALKEPDGRKPYYINDFVFADDDLVTQEYLSALSNPGGQGVVDLQKSPEGVWMGRRNIVVKK